MKRILLILKLIGYCYLLSLLISSHSFALQSSVLKKSENPHRKEEFQHKKSPSEDRFFQSNKQSMSQDFNQKFSGKEIRLETWDKHFSDLGQKKIFSDKSNSSFDKLLDKQIQEMNNIEIEESNWSQHLAKIRKDAGINLSQQSQILDDKESYNLILQNIGYFEEMAERMDLKSINRYQFRSNRPEGEIPVDKLAENAENMN